VTVRLPQALRAYAGGASEVRVPAATVGELVRRLVEEHPSLRRHLTGPDGTLRRSVAVFVNDTDSRSIDGEATRVNAGDVVALVPSVAGGAPRSNAAASQPQSKPPRPELTPDEVRRYSRHLLLPEFGVAGQRKLKESRVLVVGAGGLGGPAALYLAAAGVGVLGLAEFDQVELSNLQRQILFTTGDVGRPKLDRAAERLRQLNPEVTVERHAGRLVARTALEIVRSYDLVLDGTDNFPTRYLLNDACVLTGRPNVYGSIYRFEGQVSVFDASRGPCYRCLYPEPPPPDLVPSCAEAGVLGVLPGVVGTLQATEALKLLTGIGEPLIGRLLLYDAAAMRFRELELAKNPSCVVCSPGAPQRTLIDYDAFCGVAEESAGRSAVPEISAPELKAALASGEPLTLVDVREPSERQISRLAGALEIPKAEVLAHTDELAKARSLVVFCRAGSRSADVVRSLLDLGFTNVRNLKGGINAWAETVDRTMPVY
jgi:molybdopterin/thiamine biosynthesis adenylyltransferase/rhodanese-related sulfurtransferase/molybdopterin converting factor small subunit